MLKSLKIVFPCFLISLTLTPGNAAPKADLSKLVVVGDSLSAGFQNGSLLGSQQVHGYAAVLADRARVALPLPLIAEPGIPNALYLVSPGPPPDYRNTAGPLWGRVDYSLQPMDLAVPGHAVRDALNTRPGMPVDSLTDLVLGLPGMLGGVSPQPGGVGRSAEPNCRALLAGKQRHPRPGHGRRRTPQTPVDDFRAAFAESMRRLAAKNATIAVANIPDVSAIPYFTSAEKLASQIGLPLEIVGPILGLRPGSFVTPEAFPIIQQILGGAAGPLPGAVVLDPTELAQIRGATDAYAAIVAEATRYGAALVDIHALFDRIMTHGFEVGGRRLSTEFLGGIFSLDRIHPRHRIRIIANEFIHAIELGLCLTESRPLSIDEILKDDPLAPIKAVSAVFGAGHVRPDWPSGLKRHRALRRLACRCFGSGKRTAGGAINGNASRYFGTAG